MVVALFGLIWMLKGEIKVSKRRRIKASDGRKLGALMFFGSIILFFIPVPQEAAFICSLAWAALPIVVGLIIAEDIGLSELEA